MATLTGNSIASTYKDLLQVSNSNAGVDATLRTVDDGEGTASALSISSAAIQVDNIKLDGNTITSEDTNGNITLTPNGTGDTILNGNVGIGTDSPTSGLDVTDASSSATINISSAVNSNAALRFRETTLTKWDVFNDGDNSDKFRCLSAAGYGAYLQQGSHGWTNESDARVKSDITNITGALDKIKLIRGVTYKHNNDSPDRKLGKHVGVIAQELLAAGMTEPVDSHYEALEKDVDKGKAENVGDLVEQGVYGVTYTAIIPYLIEGMKEQQALIESLTARLTALENA